MLATGRQLGRYKIRGLIGTGGMGEVYLARDVSLDRDVAIKVLPEHFASDPERLARFQREARAVAALSHPGILAIHDVGSDEGVHYAVMELLKGETLRSRLSQSMLAWRKAVEIGAAIADGLAAAHAKGVIHRDLKPENLFITADGLVKILDFGLARIDQAGAPGAETGPYLPDQTETGTVMGTLGYMSPEQIRGQPVDSRSDIFSLGCILHEMLTGKHAFARDTRADVLAATLNDEPPELDESVPVELRRVVRHCLEKSLEVRLQSARDLAFDLRAMLAESSIWKSATAGHVAPRWRFRALVGVAAVALVALVAISIPFLRNQPAPPEQSNRQPDIASAVEALAVLPFIAAGQGDTLEELSEGIPDGIIKSLYTLRNLKVRPFSSVLSYKGQSPDPTRIRDELQVQAVLTGRVAQQAEQLLVSVQLVDLRDNSVIWAEQFRRGVTEVFTVQEEISKEIARQLRLHLSGEEEQRLAKRHTENPEAFQLYIKGRHLFNSASSEAEMEKAIGFFQQAVEKDSSYAMAYAGVAECYYWLSNVYKAPNEVIPQAKQAANKALQIDDSLGEAHALLGIFLAVYDWDFPAAEKEFRRAVELNPNSALVRTYYGLCLAIMGRFEPAQNELRLGRELDPSSIFNQAYAIYPLYFARQYDSAIEQFESIIETNPDHFLAHAFLGLNYEQKGDYDRAIAAFKKNIELGGTTEGRAQLAHVYAVAGMRPEAQQILDELLQLANERFVAAYNIGMIYVGLGETDRAFEWLERAAEDHSEWFASLKVDPRLDPIRKDPRFDELLRHLRFEP